MSDEELRAILDEAFAWPAPRRARFMPKRIDDLRSELVPMIGKIGDFRYAGTSDDDEPYPGQKRWTSGDPGFDWWWIPDEDLEDVEPKND